jgi:hypothetical protein
MYICVDFCQRHGVTALLLELVCILSGVGKRLELARGAALHNTTKPEQVETIIDLHLIPLRSVLVAIQVESAPLLPPAFSLRCPKHVRQ